MGILSLGWATHLLSVCRRVIILSPEAADDLGRLQANVRTWVKREIERYLKHEPTKTSKSRIKRLRGIRRPQYRLRLDDIRIFYDVSIGHVEVLAIVRKAEAAAWLEKLGEKE